MRFALTPEQRDFAQALDTLLQAHDVAGAARAWAADDLAAGLDLWRKLSETGVTALMVPEAHGGLAGSVLDLTVAFRELGRHAVPGPWVETVAHAPFVLAGVDGADSMLSAIAEGNLVVAVVTPDAPGRAGDVRGAGLVLVVDEGLHRGSVTARHTSIDPARQPADVEIVERVGAADENFAATAALAREHAVLAAAAQLLGAGERMLAMSVEYVAVRTQFGRPVGTYQAVKHLLADVKVALEFAAPLVHGAALALDGRAEDAPRRVSAAKVATSDAAVLAARTALQVHGAIGYTLEHDLSLWFGKVHALAEAWGTRRAHRERVVASLVEAR